MTQSSPVTDYIVKAVADCENVLPDDLPPLAEKLDTETFQRLVPFEDKLTEPLTFEYLFYNITVLPDGEVIVSP